MDTTQFLTQYLVSRRHTNSLKWDALEKKFGNADLTAMWVADMEFKTCPAITAALEGRVAHGVYGYTLIPDSYYDAVIGWHKRRHGYTLKREWFRFSSGVVNALYSVINALTQPGDGVLILTPVYYPFHYAINDTGRTLYTSDLVADESGRYYIDFTDVEAKLRSGHVRMFILCNPHNPVSRVWSEAELTRLFVLCNEYDVQIISDEIHQDIIPGSLPFTPALRVANGKYQDRIIVVNSASKSFNLASLLHSHLFIPNENVRKQYMAYMKTLGHIEPNALSITATEAAYTHGDDWLDALIDVIRQNAVTFSRRLKEAAPKLIITPLEGTYLCWVDFRAYLAPEATKAFLQDTCGVAVDFGEWFAPHCQGFARFNLATDPAIVEDVARRIGDGLASR
ncbi:MalY/PatB family protein [uncultured Veillonella sp.]|uniref:MalY/PatB family protein n=1 Tax=uncultured Veillonella sp. TaxID=159268 RepID=UPI00259520F8|nr:MalY/PatB family protein [uncultured Veillonella sp.]